MKRAQSTGDHRTRVGKERRARTEQKIVEAALRVFAERGPEAPVIDEFVTAAGIARGTFYNHFTSVDALLTATSEWTTRQVIERIDAVITELDDPLMRLGVGIRCYFAHARTDPLWCRFVSRVWRVGARELPLRDVDSGIRLGLFQVTDREAAHDMLFGGIREATRRMGDQRVAADFGDRVVELCLLTLRASPRSIAAVLAYELPPLTLETTSRSSPERSTRRASGPRGGKPREAGR